MYLRVVSVSSAAEARSEADVCPEGLLDQDTLCMKSLLRAFNCPSQV